MQQRSEETHARLLEAAQQKFGQAGYDATSVADICKLAGVSKGAFFHHFPTKQAVFMALLEAWLDALDVNFNAIRQQSPTISDAIVKMARMVGGVFQAADVRLSIFLEFWMQSHRDPEIWQTTVAPYRRYQAYFADLIREGIAQGSLRLVDPEMAARALVSQAIGLLMQGLFDPQLTDWEKETEQAVQLLIDGFANHRNPS